MSINMTSVLRVWLLTRPYRLAEIYFCLQYQ